MGPYDWLNRFYSFFVTATLGTGVALELKHVAETSICVLKHLNELAWAIDKWLWFTYVLHGY